jgi:hypothetical protein
MPTRYEDGSIFKVRRHQADAELTLKLTEAEFNDLMAVDQRRIPLSKRSTIQMLVELLISNSDDPRAPNDVLERLFNRAAATRPHAHDVETSQKAIPNTKRWTENLRNAYAILREAPDGFTDEEAQDLYAKKHHMDRRDIGNRWRPARIALVNIGLVRDTKTKRLVRSNREAIVWSAVDSTWTPPGVDETMDKEAIIDLIKRRDEAN